MPADFCARSLPGASCFYANISFFVIFCVFYSAVIFILRWKDSSLLLIVVCLYDNCCLVLLFFASSLRIVYFFEFLVLFLYYFFMLYRLALRCFSISVGYYVHWNVLSYWVYLLCTDDRAVMQIVMQLSVLQLSNSNP